MRHNLKQLAQLIQARNKIAAEITALIGRPAQIGHLGEFIAAQIFDISLEASASAKSKDGHFYHGPLAGQSVNIKWYSEQDGLLAITPDALPEYYLVLTGPTSGAMSSRGEVRPWLIEYIYLFDAYRLAQSLRRRGIKMSVATSIRKQYWLDAEIYPTQRNKDYQLSKEQRHLLSLFGLQSGI